jgi:hypothetical protein
MNNYNDSERDVKVDKAGTTSLDAKLREELNDGAVDVPANNWEE